MEFGYKLHYDYWKNNILTTQDGAVWTHNFNILMRYNPLNLTINFSTNYLNIYYGNAGRRVNFSTWTDSSLSLSWENTVLTLFKRDLRLSLGLEFNLPTGDTFLSRDKAGAIPNSSVVTADNKGSGFNAGFSLGLSTDPIPDFLTTGLSGKFLYTSPYQPNKTGDPDTDTRVNETYTVGCELSISLVPCSKMNISTSANFSHSWQAGQGINAAGASLSVDYTPGRFSFNLSPSYSYVQTNEWTPYLERLLNFQTGHTVSLSGGLGYRISKSWLLSFKLSYSYNWDGRTMDPNYFTEGHTANMGPELGWIVNQNLRLNMNFKWAASVGLRSDYYTKRTVEDTTDFDGFQFMIGFTVNW